MTYLDKMTSALVGVSYTVLTLCVGAVFLTAFTPIAA